MHPEGAEHAIIRGVVTVAEEVGLKDPGAGRDGGGPPAPSRRDEGEQRSRTEAK